MRAWIEINVNFLRTNIRNIRASLNGNTKLMGIVKADGYGHGAVGIAKILKSEGVTYFGVATLAESVALRQSGIDEDILVLGYIEKGNYAKAIEHNVTITIYNNEQANAINKEAAKINERAKIHIKIDTGMGRLGFSCNKKNVREVKKIFELSNVEVEGIFSHFATADKKDDNFVFKQFKRFTQFVSSVESLGVKMPLKHIANSAATLKYPETHLDMVRVGIALYGLYPSVEMRLSCLTHLSPVMSIKARLAQVKWLEKGCFVGYGASYKTKDRIRVGVVTVGYADGIFRALSNIGHVIICGIMCPIVGKVCMDQLMVDITQVSYEANEGDEVIIMGNCDERNISAYDVANIAYTISYEVVTRVGKRLPRIYMDNNT